MKRLNIPAEFPALRKLERQVWWARTFKQAAWFALILFVLALAITYARAEPQGGVTTFRDSSGRTIGTMTDDKRGNTTFRDLIWPHHRHVEHRPQGTTTFRDSSGRTTGTTSNPVRPR